VATGSELLTKYRSKAVIFREMVLLPKDAALEFLDDCEREDIRLLGCDGFSLPQGDAIRSSLDDVLDVSGKEYWDYSVSELCDVLRDHVRMRAWLVFEFTLP
jgi:hypothetical protein